MPLMSNFNVNGHDYEIKDAAARGDISTLQTSKEAVANKVTSISNTSTDTEYPSAKCVYDSLPKLIYEEVTYGTSTDAQISAIINRGHVPAFWYQERFYVCTLFNNYWAMFSSVQTYAGPSLSIFGANFNRSAGTWGTAYYLNTTSISSSSTDGQLPSAKAVYDFVTASTSKIYAHKIKVVDDGSDPDETYTFEFTIINSSSTPISLGITDYAGMIFATIGHYDHDVLGISLIPYTLYYDGVNIRLVVTGFDNSALHADTVNVDMANVVITDTVVQL